MVNITVFGAGLVGKAIALDLAERFQVTAVDNSKQALENLASRNTSIRLVQADLSNESNIFNTIQSADLVVSAVPGYMGYKTLESVIRGGKNVVDIAFFPEDALSLDPIAKQHDVTAVVDMGVAPGLSNLLLGYHSIEMDVKEFKCMVGGLPKYPKPPFNYKAPFSPIDVIEEYTRPARIVRDGKVLTLPALTEIEQVEFEMIGKLEAFNTDGLRTLIHSFPEIPNMVEKTLRYPGHAALIQSLINIGFLGTDIIETPGGNISPIHLSSELFKKHWKLEEDEPEFTVMSIDISGTRKQNTGDNDNYRYYLYDEYDTATSIGSMARTTGYTCTAAVALILENIITTRGIITPEFIGQHPGAFERITKHYEKRNIKLRTH